MPQEQSPLKSSKIRRFVASFLLIFITTAIGLYFFTQTFQVRKVEIISPDDAVKILGIENFYHKNILFLSDSEIRKTLEEANPQVKDLRIEKIYPESLKLTIALDQGIAAMSVDQGYFIVSPKGRIMAKVKKKPGQLPVISYYQKLHYSSYQTGDFVDLRDIITALYFLQKTRDLGLQTSSIDINGFNMIRLQLENKMILFTSEKSIQEQDYQLEILIRQFKVEGRDFKALDFRFEKPIVTLQ